MYRDANIYLKQQIFNKHIRNCYTQTLEHTHTQIHLHLQHAHITFSTFVKISNKRNIKRKQNPTIYNILQCVGVPT